MQTLSEADFILNADGSIYHLNLLPEDIANTIITVGDPDRVAEISQYFDKIELRKGKREFITHTGYVGKKRITVLSTGIGTDNIDIVLNELDALVNINFDSRTVKPQLTSLAIIRIGTSGAIQEDIPMGSILASTYGLGLDTLMHYYASSADDKTEQLRKALITQLELPLQIQPYLSAADPGLLHHFGKDMMQGITATAPGFYAPQGRQLRVKNVFPDLISRLNRFQYAQHRISNLEMETAGIYALANQLGHRALSINAILASRVKNAFSPHPKKIVQGAIKTVLERI